jgi:hypothetical protein
MGIGFAVVPAQPSCRGPGAFNTGRGLDRMSERCLAGLVGYGDSSAAESWYYPCDPKRVWRWSSSCGAAATGLRA